MFTGIIEEKGIVIGVITTGSNKTFRVSSPISHELTIDQSVSHNGVCLTVEVIDNGIHQVTAIAETLQKTNLGDLKEHDTINLERCMPMNGRLDGHIVQGHVDCTATCTQKTALEGSWEYSFEFPEQFAALIVEKGSVCLNGISLTIFNIGRNSFTVAIIPYTYEHTNIQAIEAGNTVNIEFDIVGKYVNRLTSLNQ